MARGKSGTVKRVFLIALSILLVSGALAYRYYPTAARREASYLEDRLVHGSVIDFWKPMTVDGQPRLMKVDLKGGPPERHCVVAAFSHARIISTPENEPQSDVSLRYDPGDSYSDDMSACPHDSVITIPRPTLVLMLLDDYRNKRRGK